MSTLLVSHRVALRKFVEDRGKIRVLIAPSSGSVVDMIESYFPMEKALFANGLGISKDILHELKTGHESQVEVRELSIFPSHLLLLINPDEPDGHVQVHMNVFGRSPEANPVFILHREESENGYECFRSEYNLLWKSGKTIDV